MRAISFLVYLVKSASVAPLVTLLCRGRVVGLFLDRDVSEACCAAIFDSGAMADAEVLVGPEAIQVVVALRILVFVAKRTAPGTGVIAAPPGSSPRCAVPSPAIPQALVNRSASSNPWNGQVLVKEL